LIHQTLGKSLPFLIAWGYQLIYEQAELMVMFFLHGIFCKPQFLLPDWSIVRMEQSLFGKTAEILKSFKKTQFDYQNDKLEQF